jgi:hypothetical protein
MNPDTLLALASAKAIPLEPREVNTPPNNRRAINATGRHTSVYAPREWTHQELAMAAQGLKQTPWRAALYAVAGVRGKDNWDYLHRCLVDCARAEATRNLWPLGVARIDGTEQPYLDELATLVLHAQGNLRPLALATQRFGAICLNVSDDVWDIELLPKYELLTDRFECWLRRARVVLSGRLHGDAEIAALQAQLARRLAA